MTVSAETGFQTGLTLLQERAHFCTGVAVGDMESDTGVAYVSPNPDGRDFLVRITDFAAGQLREQVRFFREYCSEEQVTGIHGTLCQSQYGVYPVNREGFEGLFLILVWDKSLGNMAMADVYARNAIPDLAMSERDRDRLKTLRREAWMSGQSGLLMQTRKVAAPPVESVPAYSESSPLPFEEHESVLRLLGVDTEDDDETVFRTK